MIPANAKRIPLRPIALGEVTGHSHQLCSQAAVLDDVAEMYEVANEDGVKTYLRITGEGVSLVHDEHKAHAIQPGEYEVVIQQEETDWGAAPVAD